MEPEYTLTQIRDALAAEYEYLCHDDFDPEEDMTQEQYVEYLSTLTYDQLIEETTTDDQYYTLTQYMNHYGN